jgi:LCP family protein required for cell wall assembly
MVAAVPDEPRPTKRVRLRRTWPQRFLIGLNAIVIIACVASAAGLWLFLDKARQIRRIDIPEGILDVPVVVTPSLSTVPGDTVPPDTGGSLPAENFLVVGTDSRDCIDPSSPYAGAFLANGTEIGQRTDTIFIMRVDPNSTKVAMLSFPRDLWVRIGGHSNRINTAWALGADRLITTIKDNFNIPIHHYVDIDFCAFANLVNAVGGVSVPFATPVRDVFTGLNVTEPGCHRMLGDEALAYARSREFEYYDAKTKKWIRDPSADLGRIRRQQDFIRRVLHRALDKGARNPVTLNRLWNAFAPQLTIDRSLSFSDLLRLANRLKSLDPEEVASFTVEGRGTVINGAQVLAPLTSSKYNNAVLAVFRGEAVLGDIPEAGDTTTTHLPPLTASTTTTQPSTTVNPQPTSSTIATSTTPPTVVVPTTLSPSITPPPDPSCR